MEKIRSFVENMFLGLPDTQEVRDAKARLLEGMSDRYEELLAQGKDPDAAFGISVAEFGSMEELRRELGGGAPAAAPQPQPCLDEAARREYETFQRQYPIAIAAGVALCILAIAVSMFLDRWMGEMGGNVPHVAFLTIIAMSVCIFISTSASKGSSTSGRLTPAIPPSGREGEVTTPSEGPSCWGPPASTSFWASPRTCGTRGGSCSPPEPSSACWRMFSGPGTKDRNRSFDRQQKTLRFLAGGPFFVIQSPKVSCSPCSTPVLTRAPAAGRDLVRRRWGFSTIPSW